MDSGDLGESFVSQLRILTEAYQERKEILENLFEQIVTEHQNAEHPYLPYDIFLALLLLFNLQVFYTPTGEGVKVSIWEDVRIKVHSEFAVIHDDHWIESPFYKAVKMSPCPLDEIMDADPTTYRSFSNPLEVQGGLDLAIDVVYEYYNLPVPERVDE